MVAKKASLEEVSADKGDDVGLGFVDEVRRPRDEVLATHGAGDLALYEKLLSDDQVYATFRQRRTAVIARELVVEPGGDADVDKVAADFLRAQLANVSFDRVSWRMLTGIMHGYAVGECMWALNAASQVELAGVRVRRSRRFRFGTDNALLLVGEAGTKPERMPERKFWTFCAGADDDDDPYGRGLGHFLYWPVWFKRNAWRFWALFLERFSAPIPVAKVPAGSSKGEREKLLALLDAFVAGGKLVIPQGVDVQLIQAMKDSGGDYDRFCAKLDGSIAKVVLMQTMTTENGSSLAQANVHADVATTGAKSDSDVLTESFASSVGRWLTEWNFPGAKAPVVYRNFAEAQDLKAIADRDEVLSRLGYRPTAARILEVYGDGYEPMPTPAAVAPSPNGEPGMPGANANFAEPKGGAPLPDISQAVEDIVGGDGWREVLEPEVNAIDSLLGDVGSLEEARDRIGELFRRDPKPFVESLAKAMFASKVAGTVGAEEPDGNTKEGA